jgi:hypothetical protein
MRIYSYISKNFTVLVQIHTVTDSKAKENLSISFPGKTT